MRHVKTGGIMEAIWIGHQPVLFKIKEVNVFIRKDPRKDSNSQAWQS